MVFLLELASNSNLNYSRSLLFFRDFIEQISRALDDLYERDENEYRVSHDIGAKALKTVANRHVAKTPAAYRAGHRRETHDDDEREGNGVDDGR